MIQETNIYSNFLKINQVISSKNEFFYFGSDGKHKRVEFGQQSNRKWLIDNDGEQYYTKKAAMYFHIKGNETVENGIIKRI